MEDQDINYVKEVLKSQVNLAFIGVMAFLMLVISFWGFGALLLAGQFAALFIAQSARIQRLIRVRKYKDHKVEAVNQEAVMVKALPTHYQTDFQSMALLCDEIENRAKEVDDTNTNTLISGTMEKLASFRHDYARMLRAHHVLSARNYRSIDGALAAELVQSEKGIAREQSSQVRFALIQNQNILKQRLARIRKLAELVRLLEARLQVIRNSLSLIQDEVYTFTDVASISDLVDNLLVNLSVSEEFRTAYEDVLSAGPNPEVIAALEATPVEITASEIVPLPPEPEVAKPRKPRQLFNRAK